jgi:predicted deacetylase
MPCSPVYEFHDICAGNFSDIAGFLESLGSKIKWNLMIIPFCDVREPDVEAFRRQILLWKDKGYSLHLHGYKHKASSGFSRSLFGKIALRLTNGEAEFAGLSSASSGELLGEALKEWQKLDVGKPGGFVAPAWYAPREVFNLCKKLGFENYGSRFFIWNKAKGSHLSVPFSTAGIPKFLFFFVKMCEKIYLKIYSVFCFLPIPRIVKHPEDLCNL